MRGVTIGQIFVLHRGLAQFLKSTSPMGGGGEQSPPERTVDVGTTMFEANRVGLLQGQGIVPITQLDPDIQAVLRGPRIPK